MNAHSLRTLYLCVGVALCLAGGTTQARGTSAADTSSLYDRLGGEPVVTAIANELIDRLLADPHLKRSFADTNIPRLRHLLAEQLCSLTQGPCHYSGDSMREVHAGHHITEAEFFGTVEQLRATLISHGVHLRERNELLALLAPMKRDIVEDARPERAVSR